MDSLPTEAITEILSRVPTLDLGKLRFVCKRWGNILEDPLFRSLHCARTMSKPYENQVFVERLCSDEFRFLELTDETCRLRVTKIKMPYVPHVWRYKTIGSSNGLLCLASTLDWSVLVMNLSTHQHLLFSMPQPVVGGSSYLFSWGFGFDAVNKLFKVMVIIPGVIPEVKICDLGCGGTTNWRNIGKSAFKILIGNPACSMNGRLHWTHENHGSSDIVSFDLANEVFGLVPRPDYLRDVTCFGLVALGGCLCMVATKPSDVPIYEIWAMAEYGVEKSWMKKFDISPPIPSHLAGLGSSVSGGKILLKCQARDLKEGGYYYFLFGPARDQFELLGCEMMPFSIHPSIIIHTASLNWI